MHTLWPLSLESLGIKPRGQFLINTRWSGSVLFLMDMFHPPQKKIFLWFLALWRLPFEESFCFCWLIHYKWKVFSPSVHTSQLQWTPRTPTSSYNPQITEAPSKKMLVTVYFKSLNTKYTLIYINLHSGNHLSATSIVFPISSSQAKENKWCFWIATASQLRVK